MKKIIISLKIGFIIIFLYKNLAAFINESNNHLNLQTSYQTKMQNNKSSDIKVALCTMGREENLYAKEFVDYYFNLGVDHLFIYDDNIPGTEQISDVIETKYINYVTVYNAKSLSIKNQGLAYNDCYKKNIIKFDWFLMIDMDEYLYIVNNTLKAYLKQNVFDKCDFIKFHWVIATDNGLLHYDKRPLFQRFKPPYVKSEHIKSIIRGNISNLKYWVHSPYISPERNVTCNSDGEIIYYKKMNFEHTKPIKINKAYIVHFKYKSTEEFVKKFKRGYHYFSKSAMNSNLLFILIDYFQINTITKEKISFIQKELNLSFTNRSE